MGAGGSSQRQSSNQSGFSQSFGDMMNVGQEAQFQNLWQQAGNIYANNNSAAQGYAGLNAANAANQQGMNYLGYGAGQVGNAMGQLGQGQQAFNTLGRLQNPGVDPMMNVYAQQIGDQFNRQVMPALRGDAMVGGGYGGSRAGIAQGLAASDAQRNLQNFGAQLYGQGQDRALNAANMQGALANQYAQTGLQGAGMYGSLGQQMMAGSQNALANAQFGMGIPWYAAQQFQGLLGNPIMENLGGINRTSGVGSGSGGSFQAHIW